MKKCLYLALIVIPFALIACGTVFEKETVGIGPDYSELKKSPCACLELKRAPELPDWWS